MAERSVITGRILDLATGAGVAGLRVEALDAAGLFPDLLRFSRTDADGRCRMEALVNDIVALAGPQPVDAYLRVIYEPVAEQYDVVADTRQSGPHSSLDGRATRF